MSDLPEEYTDGYVIFCWLRCLVDERALIPRIETERLVEYVLDILKISPEIETFLDIGTGSGVIPLSVLSKCSRSLKALASDKSVDALELAQLNLATLRESLTQFPIFLKWDLLSPSKKYFGKNSPSSLLITANLPYVLDREVIGDLLYEPKMAFIGGEITGFELYERLFTQLFHWKYRPKNCHIIIEFWIWQRDTAETILQKYGWNYTFFADLRGIERFCHIFITS